MNDRTRFRTFACALALLGVATAVAANETRVIGFDQAVEIALEQNDTLRQARNAAALDRLDVTQARTDFLPDLRATAQSGRAFGQADGDTTRTTSLALGTGVTLFDGFANVATLKGAQFTSAASERDLERARETVVFTVATQFLALVQQREQLRVQRENLAAQGALASQIDTYVKAGARTIADLYQQQANAASAQLAVVQAEQAVELARMDLIRTLRLDPRGTYEFVAPEIREHAASPVEPLGTLIERAFGTRADIRASEARVAAAQQDIRIAKSTRWPTLTLSAGYGSAYSSAIDAGWSDQLSDARGGTIGLNLALPLYDRSATRIATRRAEIRADSARVDLDTLEQEVGTQVRTAVLDLESAQAQLAAADAQLRAAQRALEATDQRYRAGAATLVELTQSRATQVAAAGAEVSARYAVEFRRRLLDYYVGNLTAATMRF
ncbi:MAG: Outer membrane efflux protein BepC [Steroidobacteraceae bacterium]|nr:Outer membrane efflux protein BepC [Steroidobacteraceae bacterium]